MLRSIWTSFLVFTAMAPAVRAQEAATIRQPNLLNDVSIRLINSSVQRSVDRTEPVDEIIQETPVSGIGRTRGQVWAEMVPSASCGLIDIVFRGQVDSQTVARRPHTLVHTVTATSVEVRRRVVFDGMGIRTVAGPQFGFASTQLLGVTGWNGDPDAVGTDFVRRGFYRTKPAAEEESATKTAWRISERLAEDSAPALDSVRQSAGRGLKRVQAGGMKIESLDFSTSASHLLASLRIGTPAAKISPPPPMPGDQDVGLRIHQSLVNEAARLAYGGRVVTVDKVSGFYGEVTQGFLRDGRTEKVKQDALKDIEKLIAGLAGQTTTIQLAKDDPILVAFIDGGFTIDVHIASIRQGKTVYSGTRIHAKYEFEQTKKAVHLVRKAPIKLVPSDKPTPGEQKIDTAPASFRLLQELLFAEVLKERLTVNELPMPDALRDVHFQAPRVGARDGWLGIGWNLASTSKK